MSSEASAAPFRPEDLVDLTVRFHSEGYFVHDPSPAVLSTGELGVPSIADSNLEKRSHVDLPGRSLGQLWSLMHGSSDRAKLEAARRYIRMRGMSDIELESALRSHTENTIERCFHENRDFKVIQAGDLVWHVRRSLIRDAHMSVLEDPDRVLMPGNKLLKDGRRTTIATTPGDAVLKRFNLKRYRNLIKHHFKASRARRAFQRAFHLEVIGIRTPRAIAFAERKFLGSVHRSYLLCEYVPESLEIDTALRFWTESDNPDLKVRALQDAGRLVGRLHSGGFANRDLKASNVLVSGKGEACVIDLDGVHYSDRVNAETRVKNLRRMARDLMNLGVLSVRERMEFLHAYARAARHHTAPELYRTLSQDPWE